MDLTNRTIWQHSAGDGKRDYADICIKWNVALVGPGWQGAWPECQKDLQKEVSSRKLTNMKLFFETVKDKDIIVLRIGTGAVSAVGEVVGGYEWNDEFGDIDGWDIQHVRRVRWLWKQEGESKQFPAYTMKRGDTTQQLTSHEVIEWLKGLEIPEQAYKRSIPELPPANVSSKVTLEQVSEYLFNIGVSSNSIEILVREISELSRIANWYWHANEPASERETVAYLVVPLLRSLGWTPQRMAIEWNAVDVALFEKLPRNNENLTVVVEAKKKGDGCLSAQSQAEGYARDKVSCHRLIVTDGIRYGVFTRSEGKFKLHAYLNLTEMRNSYPIYGCGGTKDALSAMTPEWNPIE